MIIAVTAVGVVLTVLSGVRMWQAARAGASRDLVWGYAALMLLATAGCVLVLRVL